MGSCLGYLILLPFAGVIWLGYKIVDACIKKGGSIRVLGIFVCIIFGGGSIYAGYLIGPIVGWFIMAIGGLLIIVGIWRSLTVTKQDIELEEEERLKKESKEEAWRAVKEMAREILAQDRIDDFVRFGQIVQILEQEPLDGEASELVSQLKKLEKKTAENFLKRQRNGK